MKFGTVCAIFVLLGACSPQSPEGPPKAEPSAAPAAQDVPVVAPAVDLVGHWRVAGIDGSPIEATYAIALSADAERIWWDPECALQYREYRVSGSSFSAPPRNNDGVEVCDIGFPPELPEIWSALEASERIERTPANGVLISGEGRSVLLFSQ